MVTLNILQMHLGLFPQNYCAYLLGWWLLPLVTELCGSLCKFVEKGQVLRDCCDSPWPQRRLWDKVGASVLRTKHHPQQLPCQSTHPATLPGQGRGRALQELQHGTVRKRHLVLEINLYRMILLSSCTCIGTCAVL